MATRIRLQRKGRKGKPIYSLVIADQRSPETKFIEKVKHIIQTLTQQVSILILINV